LSFSIKNPVKLLSLGGTLLSMFDEVNLPSCVVFVIRSGFGINKIAIMLGIAILYKEFETCSSKLTGENRCQTNSLPRDRQENSLESVLDTGDLTATPSGHCQAAYHPYGIAKACNERQNGHRVL